MDALPIASLTTSSTVYKLDTYFFVH